MSLLRRLSRQDDQNTSQSPVRGLLGKLSMAVNPVGAIGDFASSVARDDEKRKKVVEGVKGVGQAVVEAPVKLGNTINLAVSGNKIQDMYDNKEISYETYKQLLGELEKKAGINLLEDSKGDVTRKVVANAGQVALDIGTAGTVGAGKKVATSGATKAAESLIKRTGSAAALGSVYGGTEALEADNPTAGDVATNALIGAGVGAALPIVGRTARRGARNTVQDVYAASDTVLDDPRKAVASAANSVTDTAQQAIDGLTGGTKAVDTSIPEVEKGAKNIAERLIKQAQEFDPTLTPSESLERAITRTPSALQENVSRWDWLNSLQDTQAVASKYFGKTGSDIVYSMAQGAKTIADVQEQFGGAIKETRDILGKIAKSKAGKAEVQERISRALEDRANAQSYLKTPEEQRLYEITEVVLDFFKEQRQQRGLAVLQNYTPHTAVKDALEAPERMLGNMQSAFRSNVKSGFSKQRKGSLTDPEIDRNIIDLLPRYINSQAKEIAFTDPINMVKEAISNMSPGYSLNPANRKAGEEYMSNLMTQVLNPPSSSKLSKLLNRGLQQTYRSNLGFSPKFVLQNLSQRFATRFEVGNEAVKLAKQISPEDKAVLRQSMLSNNTPLTQEMTETLENLGKKPKEGIFKGKEPGQVVERGNVNVAFDRGVAQQVVESPIYKQAIEEGMKPSEAANRALQDEATRDLAIRRGNIVVNDTQFGGNVVNKPEFFRSQGSVFGIPLTFFKQYRRFQAGMAEHVVNMFRPDDARMLDVLKRGNPKETQLVDYVKAAEALQRSTDDIQKGIKAGEIVDVSMDDVQAYRKQLDNAVKTLKKEIKGVSQIRSGKTAKNFVKMWAAASAIQFLFDGGLANDDPEELAKDVKRSIKFGAPVNVPTTKQGDPTLPIWPASLPDSLNLKDPYVQRKLLNFVPGVGLAVNRGRDVTRFIRALTGEEQ
jgi:hypothetical protein